MLKLIEAAGGDWILSQAEVLAQEQGEKAAQAARRGYDPGKVYEMARKAGHWGRLALLRRN